MYDRYTFRDYTIRTDPDTGEVFARRLDTGEPTEVVTICAPLGSVVLTPADIERQNRVRSERRQFLERRETLTRLGSFSFLAVENDFSTVNPATAARLVYLSTFLRYGESNLYKTKRTRMNKSDLPEVLGLSEITVFRFLKEVCPKYIQIDENGYLSMSKSYFRKGKINKSNESRSYQRIYINMIRKLYKSMEKSNHKELGYIFIMLPFLNIEYNVLCKNPFEKDISKIEKISVREFCEGIGHSYASAARLRKTYSQIRFMVNGIPELFCAFVTDGNDMDNAKIFVNPHVVYSGTNPEQVEVLGAFCKAP